MTSTRGLLRVELDNRESIENPVRLTYWWKCCKCGEEFWTRSLKKYSSLCPFCQKANKRTSAYCPSKENEKRTTCRFKKVMEGGHNYIKR